MLKIPEVYKILSIVVCVRVRYRYTYFTFQINGCYGKSNTAEIYMQVKRTEVVTVRVFLKH